MFVTGLTHVNRSSHSQLRAGQSSSVFDIVARLTTAWDYNRGSSAGSLVAHGGKGLLCSFLKLCSMFTLLILLSVRSLFFFLLQTTWNVEVVKMNKPKMATEKGWVALKTNKWICVHKYTCRLWYVVCLCFCVKAALSQLSVHIFYLSETVTHCQYLFNHQLSTAAVID